MSDLAHERLVELWDFSNPAASEERFRAEAELENADSSVAKELRTQQARALGLQGRCDDGDAILDSIVEPEGIVAVRLEIERGRLRNTAGDREEATAHFNEALNLARAGGFAYLAVDAAHMLAISNAERADQWDQIALALIDESDDPHVKGWAIALRNNRGWNLHGQGRHDEALVQFELARDAAQHFGSPFQLHVAKWAVARCLRSLGRTAEALAIQEELLAHDPEDEYVVEEIAILRGDTAS